MDDTSSVKLSLPLPYQQEIFKEIRDEDALLIIAPGLGLHRIVVNLLHSYNAVSGSLVLVINAANADEKLKIGEGLAEHASLAKSGCRPLMVLENSAGASTRQKLYPMGGIFAVTSRILVVDLLLDLINVTAITGIVVLHADKVHAASLEAFIIRMYRQKNKVGFLKAFSDRPDAFASGFSPLATTLQNLFLRKTSIWPRYHVEVTKSLEGTKSEVVELEVSLTDSMKEIQSGILRCIEVTLSEIRKSQQYIDMEDWNVETALHRSFDLQIRRQLDVVWHKVSSRTRQLVNDLGTLRTMLNSLLNFDCVTFYQNLETIRISHQPKLGSTAGKYLESPWLYLDAADTIFTSAKRRVFKDAKHGGAIDAQKDPLGVAPVLEEQPKWAVLAGILNEIELEQRHNVAAGFTSAGNSSILIACSDGSTCSQIKEYLQNLDDEIIDSSTSDQPTSSKPLTSINLMLRRKLASYLYWKRDFARFYETSNSGNPHGNKSSDNSDRSTSKSKAPSNKRRRVRGGGAVSAGGRNPITSASFIDNEINKFAEIENDLELVEVESGDIIEIYESDTERDRYFGLHENSDLIVVHPFQGDTDEHLLEELKPRYVILFNPNSAFIRRVEVYRSSHSSTLSRVYFLYYGSSAEEQQYLSSVRREKDSFSKLIREKGQMALTMTLAPGDADNQDHFFRTVNTRIAGGGRLIATDSTPKVVVDLREFQSSLPSLLHARNVQVIPCMLRVGDYILSPQICVERKSIKDLISSFKDGRLYAQVESMLLYYQHPMLLVEFDENKSFGLETLPEIAKSGNTLDLQSKLVMLTISFPKLRIIWSSSSYQTARIFEELKKNQDEPDPVQALSIGLDGQINSGSFYQTAQELFQAIPGITARNASSLVSNFESLVQLGNLKESELVSKLGKEIGHSVYKFMNRSAFDYRPYTRV